MDEIGSSFEQDSNINKKEEFQGLEKWTMLNRVYTVSEHGVNPINHGLFN